MGNETDLQVRVGDTVEFLGFGAPDHYWDSQSESYRPIPNQLEPGTRGRVTEIENGQLWAEWESGHRHALLLEPLAAWEDDFIPDRFRIVEDA